MTQDDNSYSTYVKAANRMMEGLHVWFENCLSIRLIEFNEEQKNGENIQ